MSVRGAALAFAVAIAAVSSCGEPLGNDVSPVDGGVDGEVDGRVPLIFGPPCNSDASCEHVVFVTSGKWPGTGLGGAAGADSKCALAASTAGLEGRQWRAWVSEESDGGAVASRFVKSAMAYKRLDGVQVAASWDTLVNGVLDNPIAFTETGELRDGGFAWTGTTVTGLFVGPNCNGWSDDDGGTKGAVGTIANKDGRWTQDDLHGCAQQHPIYCFEQ